MGLDMHAARRLYVKQWEHESPDERYTVQVAYGGKPVAGIQSDRISAVEEDVMYWRKANHIHGWFVDNVQGGNDDCKTYYVDWDKLRELLARCKEVMKASKLVDGMVLVAMRWKPDDNAWEERREPGKVVKDPTVAKKLLPTREGFFFGCDEYDEDYLDEVVRTRDWAERMLADNDAGVPGEIHYSSSW
jgi:hypothetical protein